MLDNYIGRAIRNIFTSYNSKQPIQCSCDLECENVFAKGGVEITENGQINFTCELNNLNIKTNSNVKVFSTKSIPPYVSMRLYNFDDNVIRKEILYKGNNIELYFPRCKVFTDFTMTWNDINSNCKCEIIPLVVVDGEKIFDMIII